jgi:uncharacterized protein YkwD
MTRSTSAFRILSLALGLALAGACEGGPGFDTGLGDDDDDNDDDDGAADGDADGDSDVGGDGDCAALDDNFQDEWADLEQQVLQATNERRAAGANCGSEGNFGPAAPLAMQSQLRAAARRHSWHMGEEGYFAHESPGGPCGNTPWDRIETAGYTGWTALGENIAAGYPAVQQVMDGWMGSDGHCANIMSPSFTEIGIGYASVPGSPYTVYWTQDFGASSGN